MAGTADMIILTITLIDTVISSCAMPRIACESPLEEILQKTVTDIHSFSLPSRVLWAGDWYLSSKVNQRCYYSTISVFTLMSIRKNIKAHRALKQNLPHRYIWTEGVISAVHILLVTAQTSLHATTRLVLLCDLTFFVRVNSWLWVAHCLMSHQISYHESGHRPM